MTAALRQLFQISAHITQRHASANFDRVQGKSWLVLIILVLFTASIDPCNAITLTSLYGFNEAKGVTPIGGLVKGNDGNFYGTTAGGHPNQTTYHGTIFKITPDGKLTVLYSFTGGNDGDAPNSRLILGSDGNFYGTTYEGGTFHGTVFKITPAGVLTTLHNFAGGAEGIKPYSAIIQASDGNFYGTTSSGGNFNHGTVYKLTPGGTFNTLYTFHYVFGQPDGREPWAGLVQGNDGNLYGTTRIGGMTGKGTVFRITLGGNYTTLHSFAGGADGEQPTGDLVQGTDGKLYGTTNGGLNGPGTVFKITTDGQQYSVLHNFTEFTDDDGEHPYAGLILGENQVLYGTTENSYNAETHHGRAGTVFSITYSGVLTTLYSFGAGDGSDPQGQLLRDTDGKLYGTTSKGGTFAVGTVFQLSFAPPPVLTTLYSFDSNGGYPVGELIQAKDGFLYGVHGATEPSSVFKVSLAGTLITVTPISGSVAGLIQATDGNFYGTTGNGGQYDRGTAFQMTPSGMVTTLYSFDDQVAPLHGDGEYPEAPLIQASDGSFYGTTNKAWPEDVVYYWGLGSVFKVSPAGVETQLVRFGLPLGSMPTDPVVPGAYPLAGLLEGPDHKFYGTTREGGTYDGGEIFQTTSNGGLVIIHNFYETTEGRFPESELVDGGDGKFYSTASVGGFNSGGTVFSITPAGTYALLHAFGNGDGDTPKSRLLKASDGNFYGTTQFGGEHDKGTIFKLSPNGVFTRIHSFNGSDGEDVEDGLVEANDGNLYGMTRGGGDSNGGTVFKLNTNAPTNPDPSARLLNVSTRLRVQTGDKVLIGGFIVSGSAPEQILLRALGPTLQNFGINGFLPDTVLELHDGNSALIATNDNWKDTQQAAITATGKAPPNDVESAILRSLSPGNYTAIVRGKNNTTGVALVDAYDVDQSVATRLNNISTRGFVDVNQNVMIGGFISGNGNIKVIVRALGPTLAQFGVSNVLPDPTLELRDANGVILVSNDNWQDSQKVDIELSGLAPPNPVESAIIFTRPAGNTTAIVRGKNNATGNALVEVYSLN